MSIFAWIEHISRGRPLSLFVVVCSSGSRYRKRVYGRGRALRHQALKQRSCLAVRHCYIGLRSRSVEKSEAGSNGQRTRAQRMHRVGRVDEYEYEVVILHYVTELAPTALQDPPQTLGGTRPRPLDTSLARELAPGPQKGRRNEVY